MKDSRRFISRVCVCVCGSVGEDAVRLSTFGRHTYRQGPTMPVGEVVVWIYFIAFPFRSGSIYIVS